MPPHGEHLFIGGFEAGHVTEQDVRGIIGTWAEIERIVLKDTFCFVYFKDLQMMRGVAAQLDGLVFQGRRLGVRVQGGADKPKPERKNPELRNRTHNTLFMAGLSNISETELRPYLEQYGTVISVIMKARGVGFVNYENRSEVLAAANGLNGVRISGSRLVAREQTQENRAATTKVRDVSETGQMTRKKDLHDGTVDDALAVSEVFIGGFGTAPQEAVKTAVTALCSNYGTIYKMYLGHGHAFVRFTTDGPAEKMAKDFPHGADWASRKLDVRCQGVNKPAVAVHAKEHYVSVTGLPVGAPATLIKTIIIQLTAPHGPVAAVLPGAGPSSVVLKFVKEGVYESFMSAYKDEYEHQGMPLTIAPCEKPPERQDTAPANGEWGGWDGWDGCSDWGGVGVVRLGPLAEGVTNRDLHVLFNLFGEASVMINERDMSAVITFEQLAQAAAAGAFFHGHILEGVPMKVLSGDAAQPPSPTPNQPMAAANGPLNIMSQGYNPSTPRTAQAGRPLNITPQGHPPLHQPMAPVGRPLNIAPQGYKPY